MKNFTYILFTLLLFGSCKKNFQEINTNPNAPQSAEPALLLRHSIYNYGDEMSYESFVAGNLLSQHFTQVDFNLFDRHSLTETQYGGNPWPLLYMSLRDNQIILDQAQSNSIYNVYEGPSLIMKAFYTAVLTDLYGDVPYSEALQGISGNVTPKYDNQSDIYTAENGILNNLDKGIAAIEAYNSAIPLEGDILFNGDLQAWIKFANSLKLKYLMRISDAVNVEQEIQDLFLENNFIGSNSENASFDFSGSQPNNFRMANLRIGDFNLFIMSETADSILTTLGDKRIETFYRPYENDTTGNGYNGLLNGPDASNTSITISDYSLTGSIFRENTSLLDANFMTAWETEFLLAEAAQKGIIASSAQAHYENGVQLAFDYWNTSMPVDYLTTGAATYMLNGANPLEQIATQKWIASCLNGYEAWIEYRRTGFPVLKTVAASLNNDLIPVKMPYPAEESSLNSANFNAATAGAGNSVNIKVWWDKF